MQSKEDLFMRPNLDLLFGKACCVSHSGLFERSFDRGITVFQAMRIQRLVSP
jgi:hypothetical protein